ncbi:MAG: hypothetical protein JWN62_1270, partial [Acidimicrobiales bacterium]|nr:hypothetical protein [Acidimicrobiales bacterium]
MHIQPIINSVQDALTRLGEVANGDPAADAVLDQLTEALGPALRVAAMEIAEQAAAEVRAQLAEHIVDVVLAEGDPTIRISDGPNAPPT